MVKKQFLPIHSNGAQFYCLITLTSLPIVCPNTSGVLNSNTRVAGVMNTPACVARIVYDPVYSPARKVCAYPKYRSSLKSSIVNGLFVTSSHVRCP